MQHFTTPQFWQYYEKLPKHIQQIADSSYEILKENPRYPSLHFKRIGDYWSVRVNLDYRALGVANGGDVIWFWIGSHSDYDKLIN